MCENASPGPAHQGLKSRRPGDVSPYEHVVAGPSRLFARSCRRHRRHPRTPVRIKLSSGTGRRWLSWPARVDRNARLTSLVVGHSVRSRHPRPSSSGQHAVLSTRCERTGPHMGHKTRPVGVTRGYLRPPISLQDTETRGDKNSSQADSAGSIPVTRSTREQRCSTSESD
jgi:hypothetical protein